MEQTPQTTASSRSTDREATPSGRRLDPLALFAGVVFVAVAVVGLTDRIVLTVTDLRWIGPILLVAFGIVLVATAAGGRANEQGADPRSGASVASGEQPAAGADLTATGSADTAGGVGEAAGGRGPAERGPGPSAAAEEDERG